MRKFGLGVFASLCLAMTTATASAGFVVSVTGEGSLESPPDDASPGEFEADQLSVWEESTGLIGAPLNLDHDGSAGSFKGNDDFTAFAATLPSGTRYNSTMLHLDADGPGLGSVKVAITFTTRIIGLALFGQSLDDSDSYGALGTTYPTGAVPDSGLDTRGIDFRGNDKFSISIDGKTIQLHLTANGSGFDQIRVFTGEVPEPSSIAVWSLVGALVVGARRRRRNLAS